MLYFKLRLKVEGGIVIRNLSSYLMFIGIFSVALSGNWVVLNYDTVAAYPANTYYLLGIGIILVVCAFMLNRLSSYKEEGKTDKKDNRELINKWWNTGSRFGNWILGIAILVLVIVAIYDWSAAFKLFNAYLFIGIAGFGFLFVMQGDRVDEPDDMTYKTRTRKFLDLIDYRRHPFTISFILFVLIVLSFLYSKEFGIPLSLEVSGNPRYVTSLPSSTFVMSGLVLVSAFIYIINNGDIFGIREAEQNEMKVLLIHFIEIISCGSTFFIWVMVVVEALV